MFDLRKDYLLWQRQYRTENISGSKNNFLCSYPFIFDASAKSLILAIDSEIQQDQAAQNSVYQQILYSTPIDGTIYVNPYLTISVHRNTILQETINQLCYLTKHNESDFKKPLKVSFEGEDAVDAGQGMKKEFFLLLMKEILDEKYGMFVEYNETACIWFHHASFEEETMFHLIGVLAGLAIYNKVIINLPFPVVLYKKILGEPLDGLDDLAYLDPMLSKNLKEILNTSYGPEEFDAIFGEMNFTITMQTFGSPVEYELCPSGKEVRLTYENRAEYVELYWKYILDTSIKKQFFAFRNGFMKVLDSTILTILNAEELKAMKFLMLEEIETHENKSDFAKYSKSTCETKDDLAILVKDLTVKWDSITLALALKKAS
ncbi:PREDICTED: probable E3 ubiquitin-protein ligase HERC3 [Rhagoletis zephyria]|uniref:probable E3 ubiquitin-protein ligase HERC3 n=1 Tax=Rhagoletis zephyria TaxID=28612 RepID=UPI0008117F8A|nr:PREDICTED: probable E3 ubiquitin-protein ligase HERC3 [Rhagoletis zephyria]